MAIYSLHMGFISRSEGRSSVGFSAYIGGGKSYDQRTGVRFDYSNKSEVILRRVLALEGSPAWAQNATLLWNKVEQFEDHIAALRFRGDPRDPLKNHKSLEAKEQFLSSTQTAQTIMGAIPLEFSKEEAEACVEAFLKERFVARGLVVEYALHWDKGNPHFHGLITRRALVKGEFSQRKDREIVSKAEHTLTRKAWEITANKYLELGGYDVRIDCRSHAERSSLFLATQHEGWYAQQLAEQGHYSRLVSDNAAIREHNIQILCDHSEALIHELALKRTTFTRKHVEEELIRRVGGDEKLFALLKARVEAVDIPADLILKQANDNYSIDGVFAAELQKLASKLVTQLLTDQTLTYRVGESINRDELFTAVAVKKQEDEITAFAETLHQRQTKEVAKSGIVTALHNREAELGFLLSEEQKHAIDYLCSGSDIRILNGKAGTGKTTLLKAVAEAYQGAGYRVLGTSFQGKAVEIMQQEIGIPCKTLDSFIHAWTQHNHYQSRIDKETLWGRPYFYALNRLKELSQHQFTAKDVIMVDEANMIGGRLWNALLKQATTQGVKVLIIQDPAQIKSREAGDFGRLFAQRYGYAETRDVIRQRVDWQRACAKLLNDHHVADGLQPYYQKGHLQWYETPEKLREALTEAYVADVNADPQATRMVLTYRNTEVYALNQSIHQALKDQGILREHFKFQGQEYSVGDQIRFMQNDHQGRLVHNADSSSSSQGVKNGSLGIIEAYDAQTAKMTVQLQDKRRVQFKIQEYPHITLGYAMSIHKSEGSTFDKTYVAFDPLMDPATVLVAMTRHRQDVQAYLNRHHFVDFKHLIDQVSKGSLKANLCEYQVCDAQKPYFERVQQYKDLMVEAVTLREEMEGSLEPSEPLYKHSLYPAYQQCFAEKQRVARTLLQNWNDHKPYIRLAGIRKDVLEVEAGLRPRLLSEIEHRAALQAQGYLEVAGQARTLWNTMTATHPGFLAVSHPLYGDYQVLKADRNAFAALMQENPKLYAPFLKGEQDPVTGELRSYWGDPVKYRVYLASVKEQANAHHQAQNAETYYKQLSAEQQQNYEVVKAYVTARNQAAALYKHIQQNKNTSVQLALSESYLNKEKFKEVQIKRDAFALQILEAPGKYTPFFAHFTLKEEKLLDHAVAGELREKVTAYAKETTLSQRASQAQELKRILNRAPDYKLLKENGLDANRLIFDIAFYEQVKAGLVPPDTQPEEIYTSIQHYLASSRTVAQQWKIVQHNKAERQNWVPLLQARNENASQLVQNTAALAVISSMRPEIVSRLHQQAEKVQESLVRNTERPSESNEKIAFRTVQRSPISVEQVLAAASTRFYDLATSLLGPPHKPMSSRSALCFGKKGSTVFNIAGPKAGLWHDFATGEGGNIFQLVQREKDLTFKQSVDHLAAYLNLRSETLVYQDRKSITAQVVKDEVQETAAKLNAVTEIHLKSQSIAGTLAENYLRQERSIQGPLYETLRFLPKGTQFMYQGKRKSLAHDCLAAFGYNPVGRLSSVQLTKLDYKGCRAETREEEKLNKIQYGLSKGSLVVVQEGNNTSRVFIAEGVETALSIKEAGVQGKIIASLGIHNIANYQGLEKEIILCADNDTHKPSSQTAKLIENAKAHFVEQGKSVTIIQPTTAGDDFNDVLKREGIAGIKAYVHGYGVPADKQADSLATAQTTPLNHPIALSLASKIEAHLTEHLKLYKDYAGTSIAKEAQQELTAYFTLLQKDQSLMQDLKAQNATLVKEAEQLMDTGKGQEKGS